MTKIFSDRMTAQLDGDFVVFLIGMRINKPWKVHKWLPVFLAMPRMLKELRNKPESGFLGCVFAPVVMVQYWRSFDALESYARDKNQEHWPAWMSFNQRVRNSKGDVGIWHETYRIKANEYESIYVGMPRFGLGEAGKHLSVTEAKESARNRIESKG